MFAAGPYLFLILGMAEKVSGKDGIHVATGNVLDWSTHIVQATKNERWDDAASKINRPLTYAECSTVHLKTIAKFKGLA